MTFMDRKTFVARVAKAISKKPATVAQYIYTTNFKAAQYVEGTGRFKHMKRPAYNSAQVKILADLMTGRL